MTMTRRRLLDDTFEKSVTGNPAIAQGSLAQMYPGIEMQGWTEQDGTPTPEAPVPIVSAGTWDETAQKWEYEITITNAQTDPDKNQTVTLTADRPLTKWDRLEKRDGQWGWVYKSEEIESYTDESVPGEYFSTTGQLSVGAQVWYETTKETFVPLTAAEQAAMNALYTYRPTTVLSNQQDCQMTLTYKTKKSMRPEPEGIRKPSEVTSYFTFGVKWSDINKIVLKISGVTEIQNMLLCSKNKQQVYIAIPSDINSANYAHPSLNNFVANVTKNEVLDGRYHEVTFTFDNPTKNSEVINVWDEAWSKNIIYHEIMFYDGDNLLADYVPYYKGAGYMLNKKNNTVIRASDPDEYQFA